MRNKIAKIALTAIIATLLPLMSCDSSGNPSALVGRWVKVNGSPLVLEFLGDGTGIYGKSTAITWKTDNGRLYISDNGRTNGFDYKVKGSVLTIGEVAEYLKCKKDCNETLKEYFKPKVKTSSFTDSRNGKSYKTIKFDNQTWMAENLNYNANGSKCYDNDPANCAIYGRLYNWETAMKACPKGWRLPSNDEWETLVDFAGGDKAAGNILKSSSGWDKNGVDAFGFSALPGGWTGDGYDYDRFYFAGDIGHWWSATEANAYDAYGRNIIINAVVYRKITGKRFLYSVRCVQGEKSGEQAESENYERAPLEDEDLSASMKSEKPREQKKTAKSRDNSDEEKTSKPIPMKEQTESFLDTRNNKAYKIVAIGKQTWMAENLNYNASGSKCYDNDPVNCATYGRLYNWATAMTLPSNCKDNSCASQIRAKHRGICPEGWHIPSDEEWDKLYRYVDGSTGTDNPYDSPTAGRELKATSGWENGSDGTTGNGTDAFDFSALPGGYCDSNGWFDYVGLRGYWWSSAEYNANFAYNRYMIYYYKNAYYSYELKSGSRSVRCVRD